MALVPVLMLSVGMVLLIETAHHLLVKASEGPAMRVFWVSYDANSPLVWIAVIVLLVGGTLALRRIGPRVSDAFHAASQEAQRRRAA